MSYHILFPTFALLINVFVWSYIFGQRYQDLVSRRFLLSSAAASGWIIGDILLTSPLAVGNEYIILWAQSIFWIPTGFFFMHFSYGIAGRKCDAVTYIAAALCVVGWLIFVLTDWVMIGYLTTPWGRAMHARYYPFWVYAGVNALLGLYALWVLYRKRQTTSDPEARAILNLLIFGGAMATFFITLINMIIPDVLGVSMFPRLGSAAMVSFIIIVFVAVTKYRFLLISVDKVAEELFNEIEDGVLLIDRYGEVQRTNYFAHRLLLDERAGTTLTALFGEILAHPDIEDREIETWIGQEEKMLSISVADAAYRSAYIGKIVVIRDITEQRYAQSVLKASRDMLKQEVEKRVLELRHAQKMEAIGTLAGGIAHDFNNIIAAISGFTHAALQALPAVHPIRSDLNEVMIASRRAREIVQQVLTFGHLKDRSTYQLLSMWSIINEALALLRIALPPSMEIETRMETMRGALSCDPNRLSQVFLNLGVNAFQAMAKKSKGRLIIETDSIELKNDESVLNLPLFPGTYVRVRFVDEGYGMSEETLQHIFDPFFTTKSPGEGTGLGLSTALEIIKDHDGAITAESELSRGSRFTVYLPLLDEPDEVSLVLPKTAPGGTEHIMVVDDEKPLQRLARRVLEPLGYRVTTFSNGPDALTYFGTDTAQIDMVITDQTMPEMTGIQLAKHLLEKRPGLPIILMSGYGITLKEADVLAAGIRRFLKKPLPSRQLPFEIRTLFDQ